MMLRDGSLNLPSTQSRTYGTSHNTMNAANTAGAEA